MVVNAGDKSRAGKIVDFKCSLSTVFYPVFTTKPLWIKAID